MNTPKTTRSNSFDFVTEDAIESKTKNPPLITTSTISKNQVENIDNNNSSFPNETRSDFFIPMFDSHKNMSIEELKKFYKHTNYDPKIRNKHFIGQLLLTLNRNQTITYDKNVEYKLPEFLVILIQVHSRLNYLKELINSLKEVKYIEKTLVIFSHDLYDVEMNKLIESVDFCAVRVLFFDFYFQRFKIKLI